MFLPLVKDWIYLICSWYWQPKNVTSAKEFLLNPIKMICLLTQENFLRNFKFRRVTLTDLSTLTRYCLNCLILITKPVLSHLCGLGPIWFWILTSPATCSGGSCWVAIVNLSAILRCCIQRASSLFLRVSPHVEWGLYMSGGIGIVFWIGLTNIHIAGKMLFSGLGVLE